MFIGESPTGSPGKDLAAFVAKAEGLSWANLTLFYYVGKASKPKHGMLIGAGSRQEDSFREHLPLDDQGRIARPNGGSAKIIAGGQIRLAASFFYHGLSEKDVDRQLIAQLGEDSRLNMIATNGQAKSNCYVHLYAVSNVNAHWIVYP